MNVYIGGTKDYSAMQGPCASGYHIPLQSEIQSLINAGIGLGAWGSNNGNGVRVYLKMPYSGCRNRYASAVTDQGSIGYYATSSANISNSDTSYTYVIRSEQNESVALYRSLGITIRPFKNTPVKPTTSWTKLYGTSIESGGIFWNSTDGIISISSDGTNWITIADKNLGAATVYSDGDTLSEANCGKYYQRGNNYGFAWTGSITTSTSQVNASSYGPGNYYNSSTFIVRSGSPVAWDSSGNNNLRGGVTGIVSPAELKNDYIGEYVPPYLCFTANTASSTIKLNKNGTPTAVTLETSTDGNTWSAYTFGNTITLSNIGDKVYWRNTSTTDTRFSTGQSKYYKFVMTGSIAGSGDINFLLNKNSTTTVTNMCYYCLFYQCTSLTTSPQLPATTLAADCYNQMFQGCTSLTTVTALPATTLASNCYQNMFYGCTSLTTAPTLPATTLADRCYYSMFRGCTSLTTLTRLPATTLIDYCCFSMFRDCSKIKLSTTQTGAYQTAYRIPTTGTGTTATGALDAMFYNTGGTFTGGTPSINTTYYTSNTVV